jgi:uncharacterized protein (DUF302 family)
MKYTFSTTLVRDYDDTVDAVKAALAEHGFGVLTEIDLSKTLKTKMDVDIPRETILGACRPPLAYKSISLDPSIAAMLPCNVVVRALSDTETLVEAFDPEAMLGMSDADLSEVAADASKRLRSALGSLS